MIMIRVRDCHDDLRRRVPVTNKNYRTRGVRIDATPAPEHLQAEMIVALVGKWVSLAHMNDRAG